MAIVPTLESLCLRSLIKTNDFVSLFTPCAGDLHNFSEEFLSDKDCEDLLDDYMFGNELREPQGFKIIKPKAIDLLFSNKKKFDISKKIIKSVLISNTSSLVLISKDFYVKLYSEVFIPNLVVEKIWIEISLINLEKEMLCSMLQSGEKFTDFPPNHFEGSHIYNLLKFHTLSEIFILLDLTDHFPQVNFYTYPEEAEEEDIE